MAVAADAILSLSSVDVVMGNWAGGPSCRACSVMGIKIQPSVGLVVGMICSLSDIACG
jgi:hypothetical protein